MCLCVCVSVCVSVTLCISLSRLHGCLILADFRRASGDQQANSVGRVQHERLHLGL